MTTNAQLLAKIWRPLYKTFTETIDRACLRRDAYLDHVFAHEAKVLKDEIPRRNSPQARAYLQGQLYELNRIPVNFSLSHTTIEAINNTCKDLNIIRDCFINRILFLLIADLSMYEAIIGIDINTYIPDMLGSSDRDSLYTPLWNGSLSAISEIITSDPFWALRNLIKWFSDENIEKVEPLHACLILPEIFPKAPPETIALNCYLPDEYIPDSSASKSALEQFLELFSETVKTKSKDPKRNEDARRTE